MSLERLLSNAAYTSTRTNLLRTASRTRRRRLTDIRGNIDYDVVPKKLAKEVKTKLQQKNIVVSLNFESPSIDADGFEKLCEILEPRSSRLMGSREIVDFAQRLFNELDPAQALLFVGRRSSAVVGGRRLSGPAASCTRPGGSLALAGRERMRGSWRAVQARSAGGVDAQPPALVLDPTCQRALGRGTCAGLAAARDP